jgi:chromosomal replication initiation ATPase DnaA
MDEQSGLAPRALTSAMIQQRSLVPNDAAAIERLWRSLDLARPSLAEIRAAICEFYPMTHDQLRSTSRATHFVFPRQMFCWFAYRYARVSMAQICPWVGYIDHTTVLHGIRRIEQWSVTRPLVRDDIDVLRLRVSEKVLARGRRFGRC